MKKSIIVLLSMALIMTGCLAVKDPIKESPVKEVLQENVQEEVVQEREEIALPKIINVQNLGKDLWNENLLTQASITNISDYSDGFLYLSLFQAEGIPNTDSGVSTTKIIKFPNASQKYLDETSGEIIDSHFSQCYKVLFDPDRTLILAGNNQSTEGMKVEAFQLSSGTIKWNIHKGLQVTSNLDGSLYFTGDATDVIKTKDGGYVYISNLPDEAGKNTSFITKIQADGKEIWNKELSAKSPDLYLEQLVELNGVDS
ncbi:MAG: hypothetical protein H7X94_10255, partial [Vallitaleaceae bacterium]|nr:hypothetical protein [Vallitaleaceae bacterium]